jgi:hypothetical protein
MYTIKFFPNWVRGPRDRGTFHHEVARLTDEFPTLLAAKQAAAQVLIDHNATSQGQEWRVEIYKGSKRSVYGSEHNLRVTWTRAY